MTRADYVDPASLRKIGRVRTALMQLYRQHRDSGMLPTSNRFLYYELIGLKVIAKGGIQRPDLVVHRALMDLREEGFIPWEHIVDETRTVWDFTGSETVAEDWLGFLGSAHLDPWEGNPPFILTESRSLAGVLRGLCSDYRCRIASTNGQVGGFLRTKVAPLLEAESYASPTLVTSTCVAATSRTTRGRSLNLRLASWIGGGWR